VVKLAWIKDEGKLNENTYLIDSGLFGGDHNMACFLVQGDKNVLIDASGKMEGKKIAKKLQEMNLAPDMLILTHSHWDHAGGTNPILKKFPDMKVMASHHGIKSLQNAREFNKWFSDVTPVLRPVENVTPLKEGDKVDVGGLELEIYETPGHTNCSLSIFEPKNKTLFIGDSLGYKLDAELFIGPIMPPEYSEEKLLKTYEKVKSIEYDAVCMAHFGMLTEDLARGLPDDAKKNYFYWKEFALARWKENNTKDHLIESMLEKFDVLDISAEMKAALAGMFGDWLVKGLTTAKLI
jgi:glyoxylase-like metal-dependent hydrolase (beta-lactamase superfamily II)